MDASVSGAALTIPVTASPSPVLPIHFWAGPTEPNESEFVWMRRIILFVLGSGIMLTGCANSVSDLQIAQTTISVTPSLVGIPNSVTTLGTREFVSVEGTGEIFTYNIKDGTQVLAGPIFRTPCSDPSGMAITNIGGKNIMAVVCYDTGMLLTLEIHTDGSLSILGQAGGLDMPYPGIALDGMNVFVPLFGVTSSGNGGIAKVNIASPANPVITAITTLASPAPGAYAHPGYLTASNGYIFASAGSESDPLSSSSTIQVVNEMTMELVGGPFPVAHSPQQLTVQGAVAYVTMFDAVQMESIDISDPANLRSLQILPLTTSSCHAEPIVVRNSLAYVGCYVEGAIDEVDISSPSDMKIVRDIPGINDPQRLNFSGNYLLVTSSVNGGKVYQIDMGRPN
jgi:hypothetical protein